MSARINDWCRPVFKRDTFDQTNIFAKCPRVKICRSNSLFTLEKCMNSVWGHIVHLSYTLAIWTDANRIYCSGNGRSAGGVVCVRGSSVRPWCDKPLCCPWASQAQIPCAGEINKPKVNKFSVNFVALLQIFTIQSSYKSDNNTVSILKAVRSMSLEPASAAPSIKPPVSQSSSNICYYFLKIFSICSFFLHQTTIQSPLNNLLWLFIIIFCDAFFMFDMFSVPHQASLHKLFISLFHNFPCF